MIESLYIGATGMQAQQTNLDVIANNLSNVNTSGYKKNRVDFEDLMYRAVSSSDSVTGIAQEPNFVGVGSSISSTRKMFEQGELKATENPLDLAIAGKGFFEVMMPDGSLAYSRNGSLKVDSDGTLTSSAGYPLHPLIQVSPDVTNLTVQENGEVRATLPGESEAVEVGRIELADFINSAALAPRGENLYVPTKDSGQVYYGKPSEDGFGNIAQGFLEASNVELTQELLNLILTQRAYEINSRVVQASDEMLGLANSLRR